MIELSDVNGNALPEIVASTWPFWIEPYPLKDPVPIFPTIVILVRLSLWVRSAFTESNTTPRTPIWWPWIAPTRSVSWLFFPKTWTSPSTVPVIGIVKSCVKVSNDKAWTLAMASKSPVSTTYWPLTLALPAPIDNWASSMRTNPLSYTTFPCTRSTRYPL